ncbi:MAG: hypothetical protein WCK17_16475 [Verrucomicrobiota bacterium]
MSPLMLLIVPAVLAVALVFVIGLLTRKRVLILVGLPGPILLLFWYFLASARPDPQTEFDRRFGAENRSFAADLQTIKPTMMDGYFISFRISPADFAAHIQPNFTPEIPIQPPGDFLRPQKLPTGWPLAILSAETAMYRQVGHFDVFLLYFPDEQRAYAAVRYDAW